MAVIKHDGHEFELDVAGTDTWKLRQAGAYGTFPRSRLYLVGKGVAF